MDEATFQAWRERSIREYAEEKVVAGAWPSSEALERAGAEFAALLSDGRATPGHEICSILDDAGVDVGRVWFALEERPFGKVLFIYDIAVEPAHRRRGHAQAALEAVEAFARERGCAGVQLHVFGSNTGARELYRRAGYVETDVTMLKSVVD
jgi:ribosomal protein S18 acetylase RimI-like enzyme